MSRNYVVRSLRRTQNTQVVEDPKYQKAKKKFDDKWHKLKLENITEVMHLDNEKEFLYR